MADTYTFRISQAAARSEAYRMYQDLKVFDKNGDGVSQDEVPELPADQFQKMAQRGRITLDSLTLFAKSELMDELQATLKKELPNARDTKSEAEKELAKMVQELDQNKDGKVDRDEYMKTVPYGSDWAAAEKHFNRLAYGGTHVTAKGIQNLLNEDNPRFVVNRLGHELEVELILGERNGMTIRGDARHAFANWVNMDLGERVEGKWGLLKLPTPVESQKNAVDAGYKLMDRLGLNRQMVEIDYRSDYFFKVREQLPTFQPKVVDPTNWWQGMLPKLF